MERHGFDMSGDLEVQSELNLSPITTENAVLGT